MTEAKDTMRDLYFDLNIGEILEAWRPRHAIREVIANAFDEQALTGTSDVEIVDGPEGWVVRDHGRGLRYEHLKQNEDAEKLANSSKVIGKFGVGLKDALATLHRCGIDVEIRSKHGDITVVERDKQGLDRKLPTLHALIRPASDTQRVGTEVAFRGLDTTEMIAAKQFFLRFSGEEVLGNTRYGDILRRVDGRPGRIYVKGLLIAEEDAFACSYNITSLTTVMNKALNRERSNVGRAAYTERVKAMLLACDAPAVFEILATEIGNLDKGTACDEVRWTDVAVHACKILNQTKKVVFVSSREIENAPSMVDHARADGYGLVPLPDNIRLKLCGLHDGTGAPVRGLDVYTKQWVNSFEFAFVEESHLTAAEKAVFARRGEITSLSGGWPKVVREVLVSTTMRPNEDGRADAVGLWEASDRRIIIKRDQLVSLKVFAGTLLHEIVHARSGEVDVSRGFELALTNLIGQLAAAALSRRPESAHPPVTSTPPRVTAVSDALAKRKLDKPRRANAESRKSSEPKSSKPQKPLKHRRTDAATAQGSRTRR